MKFSVKIGLPLYLALAAFAVFFFAASISATAAPKSVPACTKAAASAVLLEHNKHCAPAPVTTSFVIVGCDAIITGPGVEDYQLFGIVTNTVIMDWAYDGIWWAQITRSPGEVQIKDLTGISFCNSTAVRVNLLKQDEFGNYYGYTTIYA